MLTGESLLFGWDLSWDTFAVRPTGQVRRHVGYNHWPTYLDVWPGPTCSLAWLVAGCNTLGGGKTGGQNDNFWPLTFRPGGGGMGCRDKYATSWPQLAMNRFLPLLATQIPTLWIHTSGGGGGGGGWYYIAFEHSNYGFASVDAHLCSRSSFISGELKAGEIANFYVWLERSYEPHQKAALDNMRTLSWFGSYRRFSPQF